MINEKIDLDILKLAHQGFCCSQIVLQLALDLQGQSNPGLIRAMAGLCHGFSGTRGTCGHRGGLPDRLLDYRITLARIGTDRLLVDFVAAPAMAGIEDEIRRMLLQIPSINGSLANNELIIGTIHRVAGFAASHTVKRTILDQRPTGEKNAAHT